MNRNMPIAEQDPAMLATCAWQRRDAEWSPYPPGVDALRDAGGHAHYWVRGWNFASPVIAEVELIEHRDPPEYRVVVRRIGAQMMDEPARSPRFTNLELLPNWQPLEWSGPVTGIPRAHDARPDDAPSCQRVLGGET